jgi:hypothetical protein
LPEHGDSPPNQRIHVRLDRLEVRQEADRVAVMDDLIDIRRFVGAGEAVG